MNLLAQTISSSCFVWVRRLNTITHTCALQGTLHFAYPMTFATILLTSLLRCGKYISKKSLQPHGIVFTNSTILRKHLCFFLFNSDAE